MLTYCWNVKKNRYSKSSKLQGQKKKKERKSIPLLKCVARDNEESIFIKEKEASGLLTVF